MKIADCRFHLRLFPEDYDWHSELASHLQRDASFVSDASKEQALIQEAMHEFNEAVRLNPDDAYSYGCLAGIYQNRFADYQTANMLLRKCVEINPADPDYHYWLAANYEALGQPKEAYRHRAIADQLCDPVRK